MKYIPVIGLEIHAELQTVSKVYCSCENAFGGTENDRMCPVCTGMPGTLPVLNQEAVALAVKAGLCMDCCIQHYSAFDRKNYFYPDIPKAYQITQQEHPICTGGWIEISGKKFRLDHIHIEEDAGKLIHSEDFSYVDHNRCGVPLIEIVTMPDFNDAQQVKQFVEQAALRLRYAGVCDAKMEQGSLRVDVNISVKEQQEKQLGVRTELKNLSSYRTISRAIEHETNRQIQLLEQGKAVKHETRRFDEEKGITLPLRNKENNQDYRYVPEPDIPPVLLTDEVIDRIKHTLPELPHKRVERYIKQYRLPVNDAQLIAGDRLFSDFYDEACGIYPSYKTIANLMLGEFSRNLNMGAGTVETLKFRPEDVAATAKLSEEGKISKNSAKDIITLLFLEGGNPEQIAKKNGMLLEKNLECIERVIEEVLKQNEACIADYRNGNHKALGFLMGQIMRKMGKGGDPVKIQQRLKEKLS